MSRISPKVIDVERNRIGSELVSSGNSKVVGGGQLNGKNTRKAIDVTFNRRFPTQLFCNIKNERYKYVKNIT